MISDNIINNSFFNNIMLKACFIDNLLDYDFNIYGSFIRDTIFDNKDWSYFDQDDPYTITIVGLEKNKKYLETSISNVLISKLPLPSSTLYTKSEGVNYLIKVNNIPFILHVSYFKNLNLKDPIPLSWDIRVVTDLDLLYLNKYSLGLFNINSYLLDNYSLIAIARNIINKKFHVVSSCVTNYDINYIKKLIDQGYTNLDSKISKCLGIHSCAICYDDEDIIYCRLACGHIFHKKCLKEAVTVKLSEPKVYYFNCPYCD